ncbi:alpha-1,2-Mannosidase [Operophtera brumata]|uniref:alpha-1,2-Mannosidase n=1 Tax=Operophtera brumata TaxID=104452 RepID=A0A0L7LEV0_OPEBR|nr:alpha-1,2-Mannosidase [Operophtera brumata]
MLHAWNNYKVYAWGKNELKPISKRAHLSSVFGGGDLGASIVDGLDTLYVMGLMDEFREGRDWVAEHLHINEVDSELSVFETTIRFVGGLLSCFALTGDNVFKNKAAEVADALLPAFDTPTGLPFIVITMSYAQSIKIINPLCDLIASRQYHWAGPNSILSELGTLQLEFTYLSEVTGNDDSFYEYLLKAWLVSGQTDEQARTMFDTAMQAALDKMLRVSPSGLAYLAELKYGGMFALASETLDNSLSERYMDVAHKLTHTFSGALEARAQKGNEKMHILRPETFESYFIMWRLTKQQKRRRAAELLPRGDAQGTTSSVRARPYITLEKHCRVDGGYTGLVNVYKSTPQGDDVQQSYFLAETLKVLRHLPYITLEKHCRVDGGYTGLVNVYKSTPQGDDVQQSYFLAETLKYLYLLFSDDTLLPLDEWVFNTEAHPLPIKGKNPLYRAAHIGVESNQENKL